MPKGGRKGKRVSKDANKPKILSKTARKRGGIQNEVMTTVNKRPAMANLDDQPSTSGLSVAQNEVNTEIQGKNRERKCKSRSGKGKDNNAKPKKVIAIGDKQSRSRGKKRYDSLNAKSFVENEEEQYMSDGVQVDVGPDEHDFESEYEDDELSAPESESSTEDAMVARETAEPTEARTETTDDQSDQEDYDALAPGMKKLVERMVQKELAKQDNTGTSGSVVRITQGVPRTPTNKNQRPIHRMPLHKSPSDMTLYTPALNRRGEGKQMSPAQHMSVELIDKISNFVDVVRVEQQQQVMGAVDNQGGGESSSGPKHRLAVTIPGYNEARDRTEKAVLDAERFQATIASPPGENFQQVIERVNVGAGKSDDDFFHLTCHIEPNLINKIENGEFVELERLLPKEGVNYRKTDENKLAWVQRDGETYLAPVIDRNSRITSIRRWEQAFRMYATVYSGAHPDRAKEVWQYIHVINTAAATYAWENVYSYDITFRHLMAFNPSRSWAITYNQMWNLCMKDPIVKAPPFNRSFVTENMTPNKAGGSDVANSHGGRRKYCWSFNRGEKCRFGSACKFVERCSYCDKASHGKHACPKFGKNDSVPLAPKVSTHAVAPVATVKTVNQSARK